MFRNMPASIHGPHPPPPMKDFLTEILHELGHLKIKIKKLRKLGKFVLATPLK